MDGASAGRQVTHHDVDLRAARLHCELGLKPLDQCRQLVGNLHLDPFSVLNRRDRLPDQLKQVGAIVRDPLVEDFFSDIYR